MLKILILSAYKAFVKRIPDLPANNVNFWVARMDIGRRQDVIHHSWHGYMSTVNGGQLLIEPQHIVVCTESIILEVENVGSTIDKQSLMAVQFQAFHISHNHGRHWLKEIGGIVYLWSIN